MKLDSIEIFGWYGVAAILTAYALNILQIITVDNILYILLNLTGSIAILLDTLKHRNYQPAVLNIVWAGIAILALIRLLILS